MNTILNFLKQLDKLLHIQVSFSLTMALGYLLLPFGGLLEAVAAASAFILMIGGAKEWYDYKHPLTHTADPLDFLADVIGVAGASLVLLAPMILTYVKGML